MTEGFLGTAASRRADVVLLLELAMALALLAGGLLARKRRFRAHAWCQSVVVLLNAIVISQAMTPAFREQVIPRIPMKLGRAYFAVATLHGAFGAIVEGAALYILLAAGTNFLPNSLRIKRYRLWMKMVLAGWWLVVLLGIATYARWYVPGIFHH